ncbi:MAG TPA: macro domain-containing protein [Clostridia bacterium]|nr:MAG: O-acetyl-ADP-ribose deacetylase [Firmicutes bacterium ADurb.Bin146]HOD92902.1 macro domain-containing protein [Clostridia bacterium]HQM39152.1 macro domain-containing protein [Clostridia bacterium]
MPFQIILGDITKIKADAIVNAANTDLVRGGGVCGSIFAAANDKRLEHECRNIGYCEPGNAVYTKAYGLNAKYIIHACGPVYDANNADNSEKLLRSAYINSLELAKKLQVESIAFPLISSGIYGYPKNDALKVAMEEIIGFVKSTEMSVYLVLYNKNEYVLDSSRLNQIDSYISMNMPDNQIRNSSDKVYVNKSYVTNEKSVIPPRRKYSPREYYDYKYKLYIPPNKENKHTGVIKPQISAFVMNELEETFSEMLIRLINEKNKSHAEIYKKANIDRRLFSKIKNDREYTPKKQTAIAFAIALELSLDEAKKLLHKAGYALSMSNKFDIIIMYFLKMEMYDIFEINEILFEYDQPLLGV